MPDPLDALRSPVVPLDPDPAFAARLRARIARALTLPKGVTVSNLTIDQLEEPAVLAPAAALVPPTSDLVPYLIVAGARRAIQWYGDVLGAALAAPPIEMPDGRIGHAELRLPGAVFYVAEESPVSRVRAPLPDEPATVSLDLTVDDLQAVVDRATGAGATLERPPTDTPYGRNAVVRDPFGHRWLMVERSPAASASPTAQGPRQGDVAYASLWLTDADRGATFFSRVLGWTYTASPDEGRLVRGGSPPHGMHGGYDHPTLFLAFAVDDTDAAVQRVREAGGQAETPHREPFGVVSVCQDDQGMTFAVVAPNRGGSPDRGAPAASPGGQGNLSYVTMQVPSSARTRAFFAHVLGWRYTKGRIADGWAPQGVTPMLGLAGGDERATVVPMYQVADIDRAVAAVRDEGGTSTDPVREPYGWMAECTDDQGTRFYLGQD